MFYQHYFLEQCFSETHALTWHFEVSGVDLVALRY